MVFCQVKIAPKSFIYSFEDSERLGGGVAGVGVDIDDRRDAEQDFVDRQQRLGRGREEPLQVRSKLIEISRKVAASVTKYLRLDNNINEALAPTKSTLLLNQSLFRPFNCPFGTSDNKPFFCSDRWSSTRSCKVVEEPVQQEEAATFPAVTSTQPPGLFPTC